MNIMNFLIQLILKISITSMEGYKMKQNESNELSKIKQINKCREIIEEDAKRGVPAAIEILEYTKPRHGEFFAALIEMSTRHFPSITKEEYLKIARKWGVEDLFIKYREKFGQHVID